MMNITAIDLQIDKSDYFYNVYRFTKIMDWLTYCNIDFKLYYVRPEADALPHTILLGEDDATAFKLKFNL